jgi:uncharacterized protein YecE (DUF72 family)
MGHVVADGRPKPGRTVPRCEVTFRVGELRIGTSGWSYPSGKGTWNGLFYPPRKGRASSVRGFDELAYYATHFDTVEINSSFYGTPRPSVSRSWVERTPPGFEFSLKLYQKFTHPRMYTESRLSDLPATPEALRELARVNQADVDAFKAGVDPLATAGKLGVLLAQFPPSFKDAPESRAYLEWLLTTFAAYPVAVELRHRSWSDEVGGTLEVLNAYGAAWVQIDEPKFRLSIRQNWLPNVKSFYYARLHGRNAAQWWKHEATEDRYNYLYSDDELKPFAETLKAAKALVKKAYLYTNNHFAAKSVANAAAVKDLVGEPITAPFPPEMLERYPSLARLQPTAPGEPEHVRAMPRPRESLFDE